MCRWGERAGANEEDETLPEEMLAHAVDDHLVSRKQLQRLFVAVEKIRNTTERIQLVGPFKKCEVKRILTYQQKNKQTINTLHILPSTQDQPTALL